MPNIRVPLLTPCAAVAAALVALASPSAAQAESVVYLDQGNVVAAAPDGSAKRALTTNGTADSAYRSPSADDSGRWLAAREGVWYWHAADGALLSADLVDKGQCDSLNTGPTAGRLDPTGDFVAFESLCSDFAGQGITPRVVINFPGRPTVGNAPVLEGYRQPTWMGNRLVLDGGNGSFVQDATPEAPVSTAFTRWLPATTGRVEMARDRRRALIAVKPQDGNGDELWLARLDDDPAGALPSAACKVPIQGVATRAGFSPDGSRLVWHDDRGIVVVPAYVPPPSGTERVDTCTEQVAPGAPVVLSASGQEPSFTPYDLHVDRSTPPPPHGGQEPGTPGPQQPPAQPRRPTQPGGPGLPTSGRLKLALPRSLRLTSLGRGVALEVRGAPAGSGRAAVTVGKRAARKLGLRRTRTLASARFTSSGDGAVVVRLRAGRQLARSIARLRGLKVTFAVTVDATGAAAQRASATRTLR